MGDPKVCSTKKWKPEIDPCPKKYVQDYVNFHNEDKQNIIGGGTRYSLESFLLEQILNNMRNRKHALRVAFIDFDPIENRL